MEECAKKKANVIYHDPYIKECIDDNGKKWIGTDLNDELLKKVDCVVFTTNHSCFDVENIVEKSSLVVDLRNAVKTVHIESEKVFKL